eukprot:TRINITY_DN13325_c0_g1_i1.p1 TRINITY_DN13325_c0_g1~~TRINITY_DN13325_c0_g1_i1.p1  ORF type:complete len:395 (+),score=133.25 TRINITY_DN13325_c0_g1_i1:144-1328(+)
MRSNDKARRLLSAATGENAHETTPVWVHRQAGRYLPEYREYTKGTDFFHNCQTPDRAATITLQPVRMDIDACILFCDILVIPQALGQEVNMLPGSGPHFPNPLSEVGNLTPLLDPLVERLAKELGSKDEAEKRLAATMALKHSPDEQVSAVCCKQLDYVSAAIQQTRTELDGKIPLIGFVGAPWTLMCYMTEGSAKSSYAGTRRWMYESPEAARKLLALVTNMCIDFLLLQIAAGVQMVQVFESSGGELTPDAFDEFELPCLEHIATTIRRLHPDVPVQLFARNCGHSLESVFGKTSFTGISIDCMTDMRRARELGKKHGKAVQGNLDPCILFGDEQTIKSAANKMLREAAEAGGVNEHGVPLSFVANLGWGMMPAHKPERLQVYIDAVHSFKA